MNGKNLGRGGTIETGWNNCNRMESQMERFLFDKKRDLLKYKLLI